MREYRKKIDKPKDFHDSEMMRYQAHYIHLVTLKQLFPEKLTEGDVEYMEFLRILLGGVN